MTIMRRTQPTQRRSPSNSAGCGCHINRWCPRFLPFVVVNRRGARGVSASTRSAHAAAQRQQEGRAMEKEQTLRILNALANGVHPATGEKFAADSPYQHPDTVRALFEAMRAVDAGGPAPGAD